MIAKLFMILSVLLGGFLILLILVQRGRGGGLAGALGGAGGQSAFGTKAGDIFTKITGWGAFLWIATCLLSASFADRSSESDMGIGNKASSSATSTPGTTNNDQNKPGKEPAGNTTGTAPDSSSKPASSESSGEPAAPATPAGTDNK